MATKRVLAIHDMCSFGRCSLTAAIPVISAMGFQVCPFPTAIFSNNLTYGDFTFSDFTPHKTNGSIIFTIFLIMCDTGSSFPVSFPVVSRASSSLTR